MQVEDLQGKLCFACILLLLPLFARLKRKMGFPFSVNANRASMQE